MGKAKAKTNLMIFGLGFFLTFLWYIDFLELLRSKYCTLNAKVNEPIKKQSSKGIQANYLLQKKGRVGDSPIAGAGLFADNKLGKYVT